TRPPRTALLTRTLPAALPILKTGKAGLLGFAGHTHVVRARWFAGRVVYYPTAPSESRLEIVVPADSLAVLTPPDTEEIRKVAQRSEEHTSELQSPDHLACRLF